MIFAAAIRNSPSRAFRKISNLSSVFARSGSLSRSERTLPELARAQPNYDRYKKMVATNVVGKSDFDQVEATLRKEPNRLNAFLGAAAAALAAGDGAKARHYSALAARQASDPSVERADVIKARALAAAK